MSNANVKTNGNGHQLMRLKWIGRVDFRHNDASQLDQVVGTVGKALGKHECAILVSISGKILRFIFGVVEHDMITAGGRMVDRKVTRVVPSRTYRIVEGGVFNPYMLQNYANDLGIELAHLKRLEAHLRMEGVPA